MADAQESWQIFRALGRIVVSPYGALDAASAPRLSGVLVDLIDGQGNLDVVIDALHVSSIDDAAIGVLRDAFERMSARRGSLRISGAHEDVCSRLEEHGLSAAAVRRDSP